MSAEADWLTNVLVSVITYCRQNLMLAEVVRLTNQVSVITYFWQYLMLAEVVRLTNQVPVNT